MMNFELHIERLILDSWPLDLAERGQLQAAFESELTRLLSLGGLQPEFQISGVTPLLRAGTIQSADAAHPSQLGRQIAQAVYGGIGSPETR